MRKRIQETVICIILLAAMYAVSGFMGYFSMAVVEGSTLGNCVWNSIMFVFWMWFGKSLVPTFLYDMRKRAEAIDECIEELDERDLLDSDTENALENMKD